MIWEYTTRIVNPHTRKMKADGGIRPLEESLDALGLKGWELVGVGSYIFANEDGETETGHLLYFKRMKSD